MAKDFKKIFGNRVRYYRNLLGLTQEQLAEKVGISTHTVSYIERGKNLISMTKLPVLCSALEIELYKLFIEVDLEDTSKIDEINKLLKTANNKQLSIFAELLKNILDL